MNTFATSANKVLQLLRQLPPRERLHVIVEVLSELEQVLPSTPPASNFWEGADVHTLVESQSIQPVDDFDAYWVVGPKMNQWMTLSWPFAHNGARIRQR